MKIKDFNNNELILYSNLSTPSIQPCVKIIEIIINNKTRCYKDIPLSIKLNDTIVNGFLTKDSIITNISNLIECSENDKEIITEDLSIIRKGPYIYIEKDNNLIKKRLTVFNVNISTMNFVHSKILTDGWDFVDSLKHWTQIDETSGLYNIDKKLDDEKLIRNNINLKGIKIQLTKIYESVSENIKLYTIIIFIVISVIMIKIAIIL
ncbi:unnamed protein product [Brachionus calyciflorus]|uniref:Uncharacterized protein n=1 Tax=Brachionus calyciflorus TaxID=104777 RepID=A0A814JX75_9BILA|nr:unnamed protein product [Brachionus calyciflorus]